jgi:oxygen-independent coproporphyrinogen III oxidase
METLKIAAMVLQYSPCLIVYSTGGSGVDEATGVVVGVMVGVEVGVVVRVGVIVGVGSATRPVELRAAKTAPPPMATNNRKMTRATGRLIDRRGMRGVLTGDPAGEPPSFLIGCVKVRPQTRQRVAFSARREPQVGQTLGGPVVPVGMVKRLYHNRKVCYPAAMEPVSLYVHIPFCRKRCNYCDFVTYAGMENLIPSYIDAVCQEARAISRSAPADLKIHTIYFGGGTPSLLPPEAYRSLLDAFNRAFFVEPDCECTLEANPGTLTLENLEAFRGIGINRLSLGAQTFIPDQLKLLGRIHQVEDIQRSITWARQAGIENLSIDLIYGLPQQTLPQWQQTVEELLQCRPDHISLYSLVIEQGTPFQTWLDEGKIAKPDDDLAAEMYEYSMKRLAEDLFDQYEISNWSRQGEVGQSFQCRHNLQYWRNLPYLGLGAGAHSCLAGYRFHNIEKVAEYIRLCERHSTGIFPFGPCAVEDEAIDRFTAMQETMMLGLRLTEEGVDRRIFRERFGREMIDVFGTEIRDLTRVKLLEWAGMGMDQLRLTPHGRLLGNQVFMRFVG